MRLDLTYCVKVLATPFGGVLASMSVKDAKEALAGDISKVVDKGMRVFHGASPALVAILTHADAKGKTGRVAGCVAGPVSRGGADRTWMLVQNLGSQQVSHKPGT